MNKEVRKNEGPSCACGKGDLYEEWLKTEINKKEANDTNSARQTSEIGNSSDLNIKKG